MVTPKKRYTKDEIERFLEAPLDLIQSYRRLTSFSVVARIRYDPAIEDVCLHDQLCLNYCEAGFFLVKLHYQQMLFNFTCMKFDAKLEYNEFLQLLTDAVEEVGKEAPRILEIRIGSTGELDITAEDVDSVESMFEGLLELQQWVGKKTFVKTEKAVDEDIKPLQFSPVPEQSEPKIENYPNEIPDKANDKYGSLYLSKPMLVHFDTNSTVPSLSTSLDLDDQRALKGSINRMNHIKTWAEQILRNKIGSNEPASTGDFELVPLMYNPTQVVMSAGDWIPAIHRNGKWIVPHISAGGKNDVLRMFLLQTQTIVEKKMLVHSFQPDEEILLISASQGIRRAIVVGKPPNLLEKYVRDRKPKVTSKANLMKEKRAFAAATAEKRSSELMQSSFSDGGIPNTGIFKIRKV